MDVWHVAKQYPMVEIKKTKIKNHTCDYYLSLISFSPTLCGCQTIAPSLFSQNPFLKYLISTQMQMQWIKGNQRLILKTTLLTILKLNPICFSLTTKLCCSISDGLISNVSTGLISDDGCGTKRSVHETSDWTATSDVESEQDVNWRWKWTVLI